MNHYARPSRVKKSATSMVVEATTKQEGSLSAMEEPQRIAWKGAKMTTLHPLKQPDPHRKVTQKMAWLRRITVLEEEEGVAGPL